MNYLTDNTRIMDRVDVPTPADIINENKKKLPKDTSTLNSTIFPAYTTAVGWLGYSDDKMSKLAKENLDKGYDVIFTDGDIKRMIQKNNEILKKRIKFFMTKNPVSVEKNSLAAKALALMNSKKITSLCVYDQKNKYKTIGVVHIHNILQSNIS